jgi:hypothetical protein
MTPIEFSVYLFIMLFLITGSFIAGLKLSGYYHRCADADKEYALQKQYMRLRAGADADDPVGPYVSRNNIVLPPEFEKRMKQNGRATASISPNPN